MTNEEKGIYITLLCMQWNKGFVTETDFTRLGRGMVEDSLQHVKTKFEVDAAGLFRNKRMETVRKEQEDYVEECRRNGQLGALKRYGPKPTNGQAVGGLKPSNSIPSPSPSPKSLSTNVDSDIQTRKRFVKPTIAELEFHCSKIGLPKDHGSQFWHFYESKGWKVGNQAMKSWPSAMQTWKRKWDEKGQPQIQRGVDRREMAENIKGKTI